MSPPSRHHIEELKAIGVQPPSKVPLYYRVAAELLTQADPSRCWATTPRAKPSRFWRHADRLWVTVGSTTPTAASRATALPSQAALPQVVARAVWRFEDVARTGTAGLREASSRKAAEVLYQEGPALARIRAARS